jgi:hypothetical protein
MGTADEANRPHTSSLGSCYARHTILNNKTAVGPYAHTLRRIEE